MILILIFWSQKKIRRQDNNLPADQANIPVSVVTARKQKLLTTVTVSGSVSSRTRVNSPPQQPETGGTAPAVDFTALIKVNVGERDAFKLKTGDSVKVAADKYPGHIFSGLINRIAPRTKTARAFPVEISVEENQEYPLERGMLVQVSFNSFTPDEALTIPRQSLISSKKNMKVFRIKKGRANLRLVVIGRRSSEYVEVLNGLSRGDSVVVRGQENLTEGARVTIIN
jgi:multidrug efflux pump subunit AcrA (membrane-fusion protein)